MKFYELLTSAPSTPQDTTAQKAIVKKPIISSFTEDDILVDYKDDAGEFSDNAKSEKKKKKHSKESSKKEPDFDIFTMKMYGNEKPTLEALSKAANTDMSSFARKRLFSDERIIILDRANDISRSLIEISDVLRSSKLEEPDSRELLKKILEQLCDIAGMHVKICKELTNFMELTGDDES